MTSSFRRSVSFLLSIAGAVAISSPMETLAMNIVGVAANDTDAIDYDGDGISDAVLNSPVGFASGDPGRVSIYSPTTGALTFQASGDGQGDLFGTQVGTLGDVDGDGTPDVWITAPASNNETGAVHLFSGATESVIWTASGVQPGEQFGIAALRTRDYNDDGIDDLLVGSPRADEDFIGSGALRVVSGADGAVFHTVSGDRAYGHLGLSVESLDDLNDDGHDEVAVGQPGKGMNDVSGMKGNVRVLDGYDLATVRTLSGPEDMDSFGFRITLAPDLDGDGYSDVFVSAPSAFASTSRIGRVYGVSPQTGAILLTYQGPQEYVFGLEISHSVTAAGIGSDGLHVVSAAHVEQSALAGMLIIDVLDPSTGVLQSRHDLADLMHKPSDITRDGVVNSDDMAKLLADWGPQDGPAEAADLDNDSEVGSSDLAILNGSWGQATNDGLVIEAVIDGTDLPISMATRGVTGNDCADGVLRSAGAYAAIHLLCSMAWIGYLLPGVGLVLGAFCFYATVTHAYRIGWWLTSAAGANCLIP